MSSKELNDNEDVKKQLITPPEGYEVDKEKSTFECIIFKKKEKYVNGFFIDTDSTIVELKDMQYNEIDFNVFATEKQAKSALAMAQISQIMATDKRFGGAITDEEWCIGIVKHIIVRRSNIIALDCYSNTYYFLAFHTEEQRNMFLKEHENLVKDYLMID